MCIFDEYKSLLVAFCGKSVRRIVIEYLLLALNSKTII